MKRNVYYLNDKLKEILADSLKYVDYELSLKGFACVIDFNEIRCFTDLKDINALIRIGGNYILNNMDDMLFEISGIGDVTVLPLNKYLSELIQMDIGSILDAKYPDMLLVVVEDETEEHADLIKRFSGYAFGITGIDERGTYNYTEAIYTYNNVFVSKTDDEMYEIKYELHKSFYQGNEDVLINQSAPVY